MSPGPRKRARTGEKEGTGSAEASPKASPLFPPPAAAGAAGGSVSAVLAGQLRQESSALSRKLGDLFGGGESSHPATTAPAPAAPEAPRSSEAAPAQSSGKKQGGAGGAGSDGKAAASSKGAAGGKKRGPAAGEGGEGAADSEPKRALTPEERKEKDARTLFVGNVPLSWDKNHLKQRLREAAGAVYDGPMKPIWFRSEPMDEAYRGFGKKKKAGSIQKRFSTTLSDSRNAYVMLRSQEDVKKVSLHCHNVEADSRHVLQFDGVGEFSRNAKMDRKRSIFVGHLPADTTDADLRETFRKIGEILTIRVVRDKFSQACKGIAFIKFKDRASVKAAIAESETLEVKGTWIRVKMIEEKPEEVLAKKEFAGLHPAQMRMELSKRRHISKRLADEIAETVQRKAQPKPAAPSKDGKKGKKVKLKGKETSKMAAKKAKKGAQAKKIKAKARKNG